MAAVNADISQRTARPAAGWVSLLARLALVSPFLLSAVLKAADFAAATAEVQGLTGLEPAGLIAALVIATQFGGSLLLLFGGGRAWIGAGLLAGFTIVATLLAHAWWSKPAPEAARDLMVFWEHVAICGGLLLAGWLSWREPAR
ncbi:MAG TPA: DoxX family protein [Microvirga sp.]|jgi:uncharacterized membrane protein YphA (DoxX/SURF4 family)|nr:DoxX family protein [Microvirga sp.]